ncbi:MAG TPA: hypothetical protein DEG13_10155 [Candidatus Microthrix parvicella]|nr:hypothetical protein [Candidatus Microthrix parvicella]
MPVGSLFRSAPSTVKAVVRPASSCASNDGGNTKTAAPASIAPNSMRRNPKAPSSFSTNPMGPTTNPTVAGSSPGAWVVG